VLNVTDKHDVSIGLVLSIISGRWLDELEYEVAGDLTTGMTLAPSKGRQMKASKVNYFTEPLKGTTHTDMG
jgi:hypothetical protein